MAVPYRPMARAAVTGVVAYLRVIERRSKFYGGLLITDPMGQPIEFVHTTAESPSGFLWSPAEIRRVAVARISHVLFEACSKAPAILIASDEIGTSEFCKEHLAPSIPFVLVSTDAATRKTQIAPIGEPPSGSASAVLEELKRRKLLVEPFERIRSALTEVYSDLRVEGPDDGQG